MVINHFYSKLFVGFSYEFGGLSERTYNSPFSLNCMAFIWCQCVKNLPKTYEGIKPLINLRVASQEIQEIFKMNYRIT